MKKDLRPLGYFGEEGSFSHRVSEKRFGRYPLVACPTLNEAFEGIQIGQYRQIVVPIENASSGMITDSVDHLIEIATRPHRTISIQECLSLRIHLSLLTRSKSKKIEKIYSHFAPLNHCRKWLAQHYPGIPTITTTSTSEAARLAKEQPGSAALAGAHTAERYGLQIAVQHVATELANQTWFFVIGEPLTRPRKPTHTTLILELPHRPGALARFLLTLSKNNLNLTRIESRPIPGQFKHYRFVIEFEGDPQSKKGIQMLRSAQKHSAFLSVLGHYPYRHFESL